MNPSPSRISPTESAVAMPQATELNEFEALLKQEFKPKTSQAQEAVQNAVRTLAANRRCADTALVSKDAIATIEGIIAEIDKKLSEQVNAHHAPRETSRPSKAPGAACTISSPTRSPTRNSKSA